MRIIQIKENQKEVWNKFVAENSSESFLQAWEWGNFQESLGRKIWRLAIIDNSENKKEKLEIGNWKLENLMAVALVVKYDLPLGRSYLYCPRMMNHELRITNCESRIVDFLFKEIKKITKKEKAVFLRFDPATEMEKYFRWFHSVRPAGGPVEPKCESHYGSTALTELWNQRKRGVFKSPNEIQPKNTLILDLMKSEEELLKEMKPKTRYNIRLAGRKGVEIRKLGTPLNPPLVREGEIQNPLLGKGGGIQNPLLAKEGAGGGFRKDFEEFWKLTEETARRDNFKSHNKNYYWRMLENCRERKFSFPTNLTAKLYLAEYENKIIAANIVLFFGDYCVYLHGASSNKYRNLMAPYLLQWRQILDAKKMGCRRYDFWGISPTDRDIAEPPPAPSLVRRGKYKILSLLRMGEYKIPFLLRMGEYKIPLLVRRGKNDWGGITRFKKGFGGEEKNYIGAWDLVFDKWGYRLYKIARRIKSIF